MKQGLLKFMISEHECAGFKVAMPTTEEEKQYLSKFRDSLKTGDMILNDTVYPAIQNASGKDKNILEELYGHFGEYEFVIYTFFVLWLEIHCLQKSLKTI